MRRRKAELEARKKKNDIAPVAAAGAAKRPAVTTSASARAPSKDSGGINDLDDLDSILNFDAPVITKSKSAATTTTTTTTTNNARARAATSSATPTPAVVKATTAPVKSNLPPAPPGVIDVATVLEDYEATEDTELSLLEGQRLWVYKKADDWHLGAVVSTPDKKGWYPGDFVKLDGKAPPAR